MKKDALFTICQPIIQIMNVGEDVRMRERCPFGGTGRSACVQEHKDRVRIVKLTCVCLSFDLIEGIEANYVLPLQPYSWCGKLRMPNQTTGASILKETINLSDCVTRVDGNCDHSEQTAGIDQLYVFRPVRH